MERPAGSAGVACVRKLECPRGLHEIEALLGRQTVSGHMSCSLCRRTCYAEPGWLRIEAHDGKAAAEGRHPRGLVAVCPSPDCRDRGRRLVSLILETMRTSGETPDPSWLEYVRTAGEAPGGGQSGPAPPQASLFPPADAAPPPAIRNANWSLLPPGRYPWKQVREHVTGTLETRDPEASAPVLFRHETLASFAPDEIWIGERGFRSYVAYIFRARGLAVLESAMLDNATYIFDLDWRRVSQMTKAEILEGDLHRHRIIHTPTWQVRIDRLLQ
ncbi:MAG: hypothetical protein OXN81_02870 [Alphaproteobacteria bacterium]|nr:hypothetical protein [Alphaproteobacteria bacterium]